MSVRRQGNGFEGHVERPADGLFEKDYDERHGVKVVRLGAPGQPRVDADVGEAVERHAAQPVEHGRVQRAGPRVERIESDELGANGHPLYTEIRIR